MYHERRCKKLLLLKLLPQCAEKVATAPITMVGVSRSHRAHQHSMSRAVQPPQTPCIVPELIFCCKVNLRMHTGLPNADSWHLLSEWS